MHFLLLNQFYPPDPAPTGKYLHDLARALVSNGHAVKVLCSRRSYDGGSKFASHETIDRVDVFRVFATGFGRTSFVGKLADYATFYGSLFLRLLLMRIRPDLILSLTTPPYVGLLGKLAAKWHRCPHAHWIMDLYPDVMFAHGITRPKGLVPRLLQGLTRFQLRGAHAVIALGPVMAEKVSAYLLGGAIQVEESVTLRRGRLAGRMRHPDR
jgi:glycosyltransferase involved in cell wall biosynthesis